MAIAVFWNRTISVRCWAQRLSSGRVNVLEARSGYMSHKDPHEIWLKQPLRVVAFKEIKADIMCLSLEPVTLRTWCLELNIYDSNITTQLLIFTWANLKCQISSLNFKAGVWAERLHRHNEAVLESFGTFIDGSVIDGLLVGGVISYTVPAVGVETCWRDSVGKNISWLKSKVHTYFCLFMGSFRWLII